jgi:23S rRNA pseudouridine2605 synthase
LQKALARAGFGSRRACEDLIRAGRVTVDGRTATLGARVDPAGSVVEVDGGRVSLAPDLVYYALHKPPGVVTTARDPGKRTTVLDLVPKTPRVFPVGRLDLATSGLLFLTNDGVFAERVSHPRFEIPKTYAAEIRGRLRPGQRAALRKGVELEDGPARAENISAHASASGRSIVELTIHEGRNRIVRRMLDAVGAEVLSLHRTAIGGVRLGRLKAGTWRNLRRDEVLAVLRASVTVD